ncbi:ATP synthase F1 subunit delta [Paracidobacterium acidisoli]|uniref:ATP synthase subunit delta n=1 Tax=Paracidobacterium acidisoli TaxID=2303751 RepID=A0A372IKZ9_9BACT|nr:ATP synthase F1 subunit delta [Paracidobacterium acidisoli]MBT9332833.1 ATP synthase F1 subunit delta [Paracidobacterium acidisoli]
MSAFAARYARAFADVIFEARLDAEATRRQLGDFTAAWRESADLREVFLDPSFPADQKVAILDKLNARLGMAVQVRNFIAVLIQHDRMADYGEIVRAFEYELNRRLGISEVEVTTARPLDAAGRQRLEAQIAELTRTRVQATFSEDDSLLGGVIVRVGSTVYDGSIRGRLSRLREELVADQSA